VNRWNAKTAAISAAVLLASACARSSQTNAQASASPESSGSASVASPAASSTPATVSFTDLSSTFGEKEITQLAALGVFGIRSGAFNPNGTIQRGEFAKWLVLANNSIYAAAPAKQIHPSAAATSFYEDVSIKDPDFAYIQGLHDAGYTVGFPDKTFKPDALLTHEQMIAMKESVDRGGVQSYYAANWESTLPDWKDKTQIDKLFRGAIAEDSGLDRDAVAQWSHPDLVIGNVARAFGAIVLFRPQDPVTRAQAALVLWKIGPHDDRVANPTPDDVPRSAADALAPPTTAPTPASTLTPVPTS
jgi:S-layer homology domain